MFGTSLQDATGYKDAKSAEHLGATMKGDNSEIETTNYSLGHQSWQRRCAWHTDDTRTRIKSNYYQRF